MTQTPWHYFTPEPFEVPTWAADGDACLAIEHNTSANADLQSRFEYQDRYRPEGFNVFWEMDHLATFATLEEAQAFGNEWWDQNIED